MALPNTCELLKSSYMTCFPPWPRRAARVCFPICFGFLLAFAAAVEAAPAPTNNSPFAIRGTLPWHNFLSGPTAWDEKDYERYLDRMQSLGLNYLTFHCYTGGAERYVTYVEPLIRVSCRDTLPEATLDTSLTARWGYRSLAVSDFAFGTGKLFKLPRGTKAFGAECALLARDNRDRYDRAQGLMRRVIQMAHARGMQVGIGFEFGILPPEYLSLLPPGSHVPGTGMPDPTHPAVREVFRATLENLLQDYPNVDWVWLWLHEHTVFLREAQPGAAFSELMRADGPLFTEARNEIDRFNGVWSLAYIRAAHDVPCQACSARAAGHQRLGRRRATARHVARVGPRTAVGHCLQLLEPGPGRHRSASGAGRDCRAPRSLGDSMAGRR